MASAPPVTPVNLTEFAEIVDNAKANCPVSRVLNAKITLDAKLEGA